MYDPQERRPLEYEYSGSSQRRVIKEAFPLLHHQLSGHAPKGCKISIYCVLAFKRASKNTLVTTAQVPKSLSRQKILNVNTYSRNLLNVEVLGKGEHKHFTVSSGTVDTASLAGHVRFSLLTRTNTSRQKPLNVLDFTPRNTVQLQ